MLLLQQHQRNYYVFKCLKGNFTHKDYGAFLVKVLTEIKEINDNLNDVVKISVKMFRRCKKKILTGKLFYL